jgi:hypothetical protein
MKCLSCQIDINPQWKHAIDVNLCPFCGKEIMEEHLKNLFSSLRQIMDSLQQYPDQIDDWMFSNHNYIKTDSPDLYQFIPPQFLEQFKSQVEENLTSQLEETKSKPKKTEKFIVKVPTENGQEEEVVAEKLQDDNKTNEFFKRAEVKDPASRTEEIKKMAQQIKRAGHSSVSDLLNSETEENEFSVALSGGEEISSSLDQSVDDEKIPSFVLNMAKKRAAQKDPNDDLIKLRQLQDKSKVNLTSGGGSFYRSS